MKKIKLTRGQMKKRYLVMKAQLEKILEERETSLIVPPTIGEIAKGNQK